MGLRLKERVDSYGCLGVLGHTGRASMVLALSGSSYIAWTMENKPASHPTHLKHSIQSLVRPLQKALSLLPIPPPI